MPLRYGSFVRTAAPRHFGVMFWAKPGHGRAWSGSRVISPHPPNPPPPLMGAGGLYIFRLVALPLLFFSLYRRLAPARARFYLAQMLLPVVGGRALGPLSAVENCSSAPYRARARPGACRASRVHSTKFFELKSNTFGSKKNFAPSCGP